MKYRITQIKKSAIAVLASLTKSDIDDSTAILAENKNRHNPENLKLLEYMEKYGPIPFRWEAKFYLRHNPENIERGCRKTRHRRVWQVDHLSNASKLSI